MLAPDQRLTLLDSLRPPPGFHLDFAVGTTYTLNLATLLVVPTAYALFPVGDDATDDNQQPPTSTLTPIGLLDALRRTAGRITVFCDAAQIAPPVHARRTLLGFLEDAVVPVRAPAGGVFHPKVWALRFADGAGSVSHRLLVGTRNLTYDRSWDTMLALDSDPGTTGESIGGVGDFLRALPATALVRPGDGAVASLNDLASELDRTRFAVPDGFSTPRLHTFGLGDAPWPFPQQCDRLLVVSPFLSGTTLAQLPNARREQALVSRPEALEGVGAEAKRYRCYTLNPAVLDEPGREDPTASVDDPGRILDGLHAKLYVVDADRTTRWWTGSANATTPAFNRNVEVLLEMTGTPARHSVAALLRDHARDDAATGDHAAKTFRDLLQEWTSVDLDHEVPPTIDELDQLRHAIAAIPFTATVARPSWDKSNDDAERDQSGAAEEYKVVYTSDHPVTFSDGLEVRCWPATVARPDRPAATRADGHLECHYPATVRTLTAFLNVELSTGDAQTTFTVRCRLVDPPPNRQHRILADLLGDTDRLVRYLLALLSDDDSPAVDELLEKGDPGRWSAAAFDRLPLTELMVRAAAREPTRLAEIAKLLQTVRDAGRHPLPPALEELWNAVWQVAQDQVVAQQPARSTR